MEILDIENVKLVTKLVDIYFHSYLQKTNKLYHSV
jgi:hypothetical protein